MLLPMAEPDPNAMSAADAIPPLCEHKPLGERSVSPPSNLLREARRQRRLPESDVPAICILDPDGDLARYLHATGRAQHRRGLGLLPHDAARFTLADREVGIVPVHRRRAVRGARRRGVHGKWLRPPDQPHLRRAHRGARRARRRSS